LIEPAIVATTPVVTIPESLKDTPQPIPLKMPPVYYGYFSCSVLMNFTPFKNKASDLPPRRWVISGSYPRLFQGSPWEPVDGRYADVYHPPAPNRGRREPHPAAGRPKREAA